MAGYTLAEATMSAQGAVERENETWFLRIPESKQRFKLRGYTPLKEGGRVTLKGRWTSENGEETLAAGAAK